jgi:hypothetical protein
MSRKISFQISLGILSVGKYFDPSVRSFMENDVGLVIGNSNKKLISIHY